MIDLTKSQIVNPMVEAWGRNSDDEEWTKGLLCMIKHCMDLVPFTFLYPDLTYEHFAKCTLTDPYAKKKRLMTLFEAQGFARKLFLEKPNARVKCGCDKNWRLPIYWDYVCDYTDDMDSYKWAEFTDSGEMIGEPHKFEVEE